MGVEAARLRLVDLGAGLPVLYGSEARAGRAASFQLARGDGGPVLTGCDRVL